MARKTVADVAVEVLGERFDRMRLRVKEREEQSAERALVADAIRLAEELDVPFVEAYGMARAHAAFRRLDEERRVTHAHGHLYCVPGECPDAWLDVEDA